ncbi:aminotransferase class I/II-fold pyridoxal phosphate-dependent enzyme [Pseudomonas luteola]|uniref:Aspartate aminotransferase family protein n=1 Tax=Pseudomonas luteola TaxID=47886 RepID=A0ABS0MKL4_PSELU|nr:aspartate aminotransferase family protein [Pseudomonas luteola]
MNNPLHSYAAITAYPSARLQDDQATSHLFNEKNAQAYESLMVQGAECIKETLLGIDKPYTGILPHELKRQFDEVNLDEKLGNFNEALEELKALYLKDAVYFHHPHYVAHLNCPIVIPAILAELVLSSINSSLDTWDQSAGGTYIEQKLIDWTAERIGLGSEADGVFTSGGTQSNLMAMLLARDHVCNRQPGHASNKTQGLPTDFKRLRILSSEVSHFSVQKSAAILGLGYDAVIPVRSDARKKMDLSDLRRVLEECEAEGLIPMAVVATAGTTDFGSIDPLEDIAAICREKKIWMHVDAAYGGGLLISPKYRNRLTGIEHADSVTIDYHKSFFQPVSCSAFLVRDRRELGHVTCHADYLNPKSQTQEGTPNLVNKSIQTTRRFDALKLWMTLRTMGANALGNLFDHVIDLTRATYPLIERAPRFDIAHVPELSTLVFRYIPEEPLSAEQIDATNAAIRKALSRSGRAIIAGTKVGGQQYLKFTLLNPMTTLDDLRGILDAIKHEGARYVNQQSALATC